MKITNKFNIGDTIIYQDNLYKIESFKYNKDQQCIDYFIYNPSNITEKYWIEEEYIELANFNKVFYNTRDWLNPESSPSTGSIVCFDGISKYSDGVDTNCFIEVSSCHEKARIHKTFADSMDDYIAKVESMHTALTKYLHHLKSKYQNGTD